MNRIAAAVVVLSVLACSGSTESVVADPSGVGPPKAPAAVALPDMPVPLAHAARPSQGEDVWTPVHPTAEVVVFTSGDAWDGVPVGTAFDAVGASGRVALVYDGTDTILYGCDGGQEMPTARFEADSPVPEGVLVLFPAGGGTGWEVAVPTLEGTPSSSARAWSFGALGSASLRVTGEMKAEQVVQIPGTVGYTNTYESYRMEGDEGPVDLEVDVDVGLPKPDLVLKNKAGAKLVSFVRSYEGLHFELVEMGAVDAQVTGRESLYWCAF
ncbi:MAG: hypothetical protein R3F61_06825 [Myxococcota bacterium]